MYILEGDDQAVIGRRAVKVDVAALDPSGYRLPEGAVLLMAVCDGAPVRTEQSRPSRMTLPNIAERTVVRVQPGQGRDLFAEGTTLDLTIRTDRTREADEDLVVVRDAPVSGLAHRDLVAITAYDDWRLQVTALALVEDVPLRPLASAARAAARQRLGSERTAVTFDVDIAIDTSTSMARMIGDGRVGAAVEILVGLAQVIGADHDLRVRLLTPEPVTVEAVRPIEVVEATLAKIRRTGLGCGFRSTPPDPARGGDRITFVVTDALPPDLTALRGARRHGDDRRIVVLDGQPVPTSAADLPATVIGPPPHGTPPEAHLLQHLNILSALVGSLMGPMQALAR